MELSQSFKHSFDQIGLKLSELVWLFDAPAGARFRNRCLKQDLHLLFNEGLLPKECDYILAAGSGSGAETLVLRDIFPDARIIAIDNGSTHQDNQPFSEFTLGAYEVKKPPPWIADFHDHSFRQHAQEKRGHYDLITALHLSLLFDQPQWNQRMRAVAETVIDLTEMLKDNGTLVISHDAEQTGPRPARLIQENLRIDELFASGIELTGNFDHFLVLRNPEEQLLSQTSLYPTVLLTELGEQIQSPYYNPPTVILWDEY
jgi:hypothetical protein